MTNAAAPFETAQSPHDLLPLERKREFQEKFTEQAVRSFIFLSAGMGLVALLFPIALVIAGGYDGHYSISFFYHVSDPTRNILVGCLWAEGMFLILFHGLSKLENWILNVAGLSAISIAMNPMPADQCAPGHGITVHEGSAIVFFVCLAIVAVGLSKERVRYITDKRKKRLFVLAYNATGAAMILMPAAVAAAHYLGRGKCESHWIFWIECLGIAAFAIYWFVKTAEYKLLLRIR